MRHFLKISSLEINKKTTFLQSIQEHSAAGASHTTLCIYFIRKMCSKDRTGTNHNQSIIRYTKGFYPLPPLVHLHEARRVEAVL